MSPVNISRITDADDLRLASIHALYHNSFPKEERRPWESLVSLIGTPFFTLYIATDTATGRMAGFMTMWRLPRAMYVEHLAVEPSMRCNGVGGMLVDMAREVAGTLPLVVEVELPETGPDASRRISFYERHGFSVIEDVTYFQPPYAPGLPDVQLLLMSTAPLDDNTEFVIHLHTLVYNQ